MADKIVCKICGEDVFDTNSDKLLHLKNKHPNKGIMDCFMGAPEAKHDATPQAVGPAINRRNQGEDAVDPYLEEQIKRAFAAQEKFKAAPDIFIAEQTSDEMMELRKRYCPDSLGKNPTKHVYFAIYRDLESAVTKGYVPVMDENRKLVRFNELVMTWRPIEMHHRKERMEQELSRKRLKGVFGKQDVKSTGKSEDLPAPTLEGLDIEKVSGDFER